ncbi:hypothetical protein D3C81_1960160 [compost metagenome]
MKLKRTPNSSQNSHSATATNSITNRLTISTPPISWRCRRVRHSAAGHNARYSPSGRAA